MNWIHWLYNLILVIPYALLISVIAERLATRNILSKSLPRVWYTCIQIVVTILSWKFVILQPAEFSACSFQLLPSPWNICGYDDRLSPCYALSHPWTLLFALLLRCVLFFFAAKLGASLQPIGLTGGIACGKSTVAKMLTQGSNAKKSNRDAFVIIDVDAIAHDIMEPVTNPAPKESWITFASTITESAYLRILNAFQDYDILQEPSSSSESNFLPLKIDRRKLGNVIFREPQLRRKLNQITHPLISKIMMKRIIVEDLFRSAKQAQFVAVDIPLLFEVGLAMKMLFGIKIVVACRPEIQLQRLMQRNNDLSKEECIDRIQSQMPLEKKICMADIVIWNDGTFEDLVQNVEEARRQIVARKQAFLGITLGKTILLLGVSVVVTQSLYWIRT